MPSIEHIELFIEPNILYVMKKILLLSCMLFFAYAGNSQCVADAVLAIDMNCTGTTGGANSGDPTGNDPIDVNPCSSSYAGGDDYIFTYTATTTDALQLDLETTNTWSGLMVTDACPDDAAATCVASSNSSGLTESLNTGPLVPGTTYYIHISTFPAPQSPGQFCLNADLVTPPMPPANDDCANAQTLVCNDPAVAGTTEGAVSETSPACASNFGVWYTVSGNGDDYTITSPSTFDHEIVVLEGNCGALTQVDCEDGSTGTETLTFTSVPGTVYYVYIAHFSGTSTVTGTFDIELTCQPTIPPPANDDCANALPAAVNPPGGCPGGVTVIGTTAFATASTTEVGSCDLGGDFDVFYTFTAPAGGGIVLSEISAAAGLDAAVFDMCGGTEIAGSCGVLDGLNVTGLTPGTSYVLVVWNDSFESEGPFEICLESPPACGDPTALATANATETSVDVSWTSTIDVTTSTVEVCPSGTPSGDPTCIFVPMATSPTTVTGLMGCTDYDAYVQDFCGQDPTTVVGPSSFTTPGPDPVLMPACGDVVAYPTCPGGTYNPNENITWTLCPTATTAAQIEFTYVDIETSTSGDLCWDEILITYSDGSTEPVQCGEGDGDGDVGSGLAAGSIFEDPVAGGCMTVTFTSDGSIQESGFAFNFNCVAPCDAPNNLILVPSGGTVVAPPANACDNANGWTYYEDPGTGNYVFAIDWGTANATAKAAATVTVTQAGTGAPIYTEGGVPGVTGDATWAMERYWNVDLAGATLAAPVDVRFYHLPAEAAAPLSMANADGRVVAYSGWYKTVVGPYSGTPASLGLDPGNDILLASTFGVENSIDYVEFSTVSFSGGTFTATVSGTVLPIDLVSFKGTAMADHNKIDWETASEVNNDYQAIEKSRDGRNDWMEIGRVSGRNTQSYQSYGMNDDQPLKETYYRLKSVDHNGETEYSEVINVNRKSFSNVRSTISPNPFTSNLQVTLESDSDQKATISVFSLDGKVLLQTSVLLRNSIVQHENLELAELQTGIYLLQVKMGDFNETRRIVKVQ